MLTKKIKALERKKQHVKDKTVINEQLKDLHRRMNTMNQAFVLGPYLVVKSGNHIQYLRQGPSLIKKQPKTMNIDLGNEVWLHNIYTTGCEDLL